MESYTLGRLEFAFKLTNFKTREETIVVTTPSMWALANEYQDELRSEGKHTEGWALSKYLNVLAMMAASRVGLIDVKGIPSLEDQAKFMNEYEFEDVSYLYQDKDADEDIEDPTNIDQEGDQVD